MILTTKQNKKFRITNYSNNGDFIFIEIDGFLDEDDNFDKILEERIGRNIQEINFKNILKTTRDNKTYFLLSNNENFSEETLKSMLPKELSEEQKAIILLERKSEIVSETKTMLQNFLEEHPMISKVKTGQNNVYTVTKEKQDQMNREYAIYTALRNQNLEAKLMWNAKGQEAVEWSEQDFVQLLKEVQDYVRPFVAFQQNLEEKIKACITLEELENIDLEYEFEQINNNLMQDIL